MAAQTVILDPDLIHSLSLTPEGMEQAGLEPGIAVTVVLGPGKITLQKTDPREEFAALMAIIEESREQIPMCRSSDPPMRTRQLEDAIEKLQGVFAGQPSLEDEYLLDKAIERTREKERDSRW